MEEEKENTGSEIHQKKRKIGSEEKKEHETDSEKDKTLEALVKAIGILEKRETDKTKYACKILKHHTSHPQWHSALQKISTWLHEIFSVESFIQTVRPLFNLMNGTDTKKNLIVFLTPLVKFLQHNDLCSDPTCKRILTTIFNKIATANLEFAEGWGKFLDNHNLIVANNFVCELIQRHARKTGDIKHRNIWEKFQKKYTIPPHYTTHTTQQSCIITTRDGHTHTSHKTFPASVVIWNGNGIRARWTSPRNEIKNIVHAADPDLFCIIESK
jgi:hypothetical protein